MREAARKMILAELKFEISLDGKKPPSIYRKRITERRQTALNCEVSLALNDSDSKVMI